MFKVSGGAKTREQLSLGATDLSTAEHWAQDEKPARDWKKLSLVVGLGLLSWVATYVGMLELIEANMGDLPLAHKAIIGFSVAMLMTMVVWLLDQIFAPIGWITRLSYVAGYIFLTLISVGFGFGFYWKVLESRSVASTSAEAAVTQVQNALFGASTRLEQLQATLDQLVTISKQKAEVERANGSSCPNSKPGEGPRRRLREEDAARFGFASEFVKTRAGTVRNEMSGLDGDLVKIVSNDPSIIDAKSGTRNEFMKSLGRKLELTATGFNTFRTDAQLKQIRSDLFDRSDRQTFADGRGGTFLCPDAQLQTALKGVVRAIDELPVLEKPKIATVEGSEAVIEAFRRLTATFYGALAFKLPPTVEELRELQRKAMDKAEDNGGKPKPQISIDQAGLSKRDYIPLSIALFVDLCLLLVSIGRPVDRMQGLLPKMRAAERGPVIQILSRFNQIHRDAEIRENFEIFRHVVFDFNGDYYVAVPLDAPPRMNPEQREALRVETTILANLFSSFEQERVFTRVLMPLLTVASIRRKLRRQGSKFAEAEAFRIYKFRDGAWSEFILGAVMGAARRVETEKVRRHVEQDIFERTEPSLRRRATPEPVRATESEAHMESDAREALTAFSGGQRRAQHVATPSVAAAAAAARDLENDAAQSAERISGVHDVRYGPYARFARTDSTQPARTPEWWDTPAQFGVAEEPAITHGKTSQRPTAPELRSPSEPAIATPDGDLSNVIQLSGLSQWPEVRPPQANSSDGGPQPSITVEATERKVVYQVTGTGGVSSSAMPDLASRLTSAVQPTRVAVEMRSSDPDSTEVSSPDDQNTTPEIVHRLAPPQRQDS